MATKKKPVILTEDAFNANGNNKVSSGSKKIKVEKNIESETVTPVENTVISTTSEVKEKTIKKNVINNGYSDDMFYR